MAFVGIDSTQLFSKKVWGFLVFFILPFSLSAQQWVTYTQATSGLPANTIRHVEVDNQNNKWIATDNGLAVFDGDIWQVYRDTNSGLPVNTIRCIAVDDQNNKWIGTSDGLVKFDGVDWTVFKPENSGIPDNLIRTIQFDSNGDVWAGTSNGIGRYDGTNWYTYSTNDSSHNSQILTSENIPAIDIGYDDVVAIGTINGGLIYLTDSTLTLFDSWTTNLPDNTILCIERDSYGNRWLGTPGAGLLTHHGDHTSSAWSWYTTWNSANASNSINDIVIDENDRVITASQDAGISVFSGGLDWANFNTSNSGIPDDFIYSIALDNEGYLWVGTYSSGLARFDYGNWVGIEKVKQGQRVNIFPNPSTSGAVYVELEKPALLEVRDVFGRLLFNEEMGAGIHKVDLGILANGTYLLTVVNEGIKTTERLIIAK